jgi:hypothetical protein
MSNSLTINASLTYTGNGLTLNEIVNNLPVLITGNGLNSLSQFTATTSAVAIPLGSSTSPGGWIFIQNFDPTNYVTVLTGTAGTVFARLLPGEFCLLRLDVTVTAPAVKANVASCIVKLCLFDT